MKEFQFKRATAERWLEIDPVLKLTEPGFEIVDGSPFFKLKFGDGVSHWSELPYFASSQVTPVNSGSFKGVCDTHTDPGIPTADEWWSATEIGTYGFFGNVEVTTITEVFNWIMWSQETESWSIKTVPIIFELTQIPRVLDGIFDLNVTANLELEVIPYKEKPASDLSFPIMYLGNDLFSESICMLATNAYFSAPGFKTNSVYTIVENSDLDIKNANYGSNGLNLSYHPYATPDLQCVGIIGIDSLRLGEDRSMLGIYANGAYGNQSRACPIMIGDVSYSTPFQAHNAEYILIDDFYHRFTIHMGKIKLSKGTASKWLAIDSEKEIYYADEPALKTELVKRLKSFYANEANLGSGVSTVMSYSLLANTLESNGSSLICEYTGIGAANNHPKYISFHFGSFDLGAMSNTENSFTNWKLKITIIRTGASSFRSYVDVFWGNTTIGSVFGGDTTSVNFAVNNTISLGLQGSSSNDIIAGTGIITYYP